MRDRQTHKEGEKGERQTERGRERDGERQTGRQTEGDRQTERGRKERQTDRQTDGGAPGGREKEVSKLVFYAQSAGTVISERWEKGERRCTDRQRTRFWGTRVVSRETDVQCRLMAVSSLSEFVPYHRRVPGEIKRREVELDLQVSPEEFVSREVELGCESWTSFASGCSSTAVQWTLSL